MEPEIAQRCLNCGAAVRGHARFCPQCGLSMSEAPTLNQPPVAVESQSGANRLVDEAERVARQLNDSLPPTPLPPLPNDDHAEAIVEPAARVDEPAAAEYDEDEPAHGALVERAGRVRARAGERVGRLREASIVVLDEAHDDPALRFVLVAAALFVLFLLILLFSHILS